MRSEQLTTSNTTDQADQQDAHEAHWGDDLAELGTITGDTKGNFDGKWFDGGFGYFG